MTELLPCPFCGNEARWCGLNNLNPDDNHACHHIRCDYCEASFDVDNFVVENAETLDEAMGAAAEVWNTRHNPAQKVVEAAKEWAEDYSQVEHYGLPILTDVNLLNAVTEYEEANG